MIKIFVYDIMIDDDIKDTAGKAIHLSSKMFTKIKILTAASAKKTSVI